MKRTLSPYLTRVVLIIIAFVMVLFSALFSTYLAARLRSEEQKRMEIWAEATRRLITAQPNEELDFYLNIIENNTTIPVYMTNADGECILSRNVPEGADIQRKADKLRESQEPIEVRVGRGVVQYIYYEESSLLTLLNSSEKPLHPVMRLDRETSGLLIVAKCLCFGSVDFDQTFSHYKTLLVF